MSKKNVRTFITVVFTCEWEVDEYGEIVDEETLLDTVKEYGDVVNVETEVL
jgi:hypothetical protein